MAAIGVRVNMKVDKRAAAKRAFKIAMDEALATLAREAYAFSYQLCPVDTGFLRATIAVEQDGPMNYRLVAYAEYAEYVEKDQPFMRPAIEFVRARFSALWEGIA